MTNILKLPLTNDQLALIKTRYFDRIDELRRGYRLTSFQRFVITTAQYFFIVVQLLVGSAGQVMGFSFADSINKTARNAIEISLLVAFWIIGAIVFLVTNTKDILGITRRRYEYDRKLRAYYSEGWMLASGIGKYAGLDLDAKIARFMARLEKFENNPPVNIPEIDNGAAPPLFQDDEIIPAVLRQAIIGDDVPEVENQYVKNITKLPIIVVESEGGGEDKKEGVINRVRSYSRLPVQHAAVLPSSLPVQNSLPPLPSASLLIGSGGLGGFTGELTEIARLGSSDTFYNIDLDSFSEIV